MTNAGAAVAPAWAMRLPLRLFGAALLGAIAALAQPPWGLWPGIFLALPGVFWLWRGLPSGTAFWVGWAFATGAYATGMHWIVEPFLVDIPRHGWMAPFALVFLSGGLALFTGGAFALAAIGPRNDIDAVARLTLFWAMSEFARSYVLTGFPWALPAYVWVGTPIAQLSSLMGPYGLSLVTLLATISPALVASRGRRWPAPAMAAAILALAWFWGDARLARELALTDTVIRVVQPNLDQRTKWDRDKRWAHFDKTLALTAETGDQGQPSVILWPEVAVTFPIDRAEEAQAEIVSAAKGASVALGSMRIDPGSDAAGSLRWRNSLFLIDGEGTAQTPYDKAHLVPFGEYLPLEGLLTQIGLSAIASAGRLVAGDAAMIFRPPNAPPFAPMICYEMIFPRETKSAAKDADWLVLATNDAWFGAGAGPEQHLAQAQMRAIENGLPVARSANTGVSAVIDPYGRIIARIPVGTDGFADSLLPAKLPITLYRVLGESVTLFVSFLCICIILTQRFARK